MKEIYFEHSDESGLTQDSVNPKLVIRNSTPRNMEGGENQNPSSNEIESLSREIKNEIEKSLREGLTHDEKEAMRAAGLKDFTRQTSITTSLEQQETRKLDKDIDTRVQVIKERLAGNLSVTFLNKAGEDEEKFDEYLEVLEEIEELEGKEFIEKYEELSKKVFGKVIERSVDVLPADADFKTLMSSVDTRDDVFEFIFERLQNLSDNELIEGIKQGRGLITGLVADTQNARGHLDAYNALVNSSQITRQDVLNLFSEIRADAAMVDDDADRPFDSLMSQGAEKEEDGSVSKENGGAQPEAGASGGSNNPPDRPIAEGAGEDPDGQGGQKGTGGDLPSWESFDDSKFVGTPYESFARKIKNEARKKTLNIQTLEKVLRDIQKNIDFGDKFSPEIGKSLVGDIEVRMGRRAQTGSELAPVEASDGFAGFNVASYKDTPLEDAAVQLRNLSVEKVGIEDFQKLWEKLEKIWLDHEGHIKPEFDTQLIERFRGEYGERRIKEQEFRMYNTIATRNRLSMFDARQESQNTNPKSIQEVAWIIIKSEGEDRWGKDGIFPLLDENENINEAHFMMWIRERMLYQHTNNSRDTNLQLPALIGVDNVYGSTISVFSMDKNRNFYFKDRATDTVLDKLADQIKMEVWLFGRMRNYDLIYKQYMTQDSKLPEFLAQVHQLEELTIGDSLERLLTMSDRFTLNPMVEKDTKVGDATRKAFMVYFNISDFDKLQKLLGEDSAFFTREGAVNAITVMLRQKQGFNFKGPEDDPDKFKGHEAFVNSMFNDDGTLNKAKFIEIINPFNKQDKSEFEIAFAREMVRQAIAERYGLEYGLDKNTDETVRNGKKIASERDFLRTNLEYAETWAWVLSRFSGAGARNDPNAVGFDAQTKVMKFMEYRLGQSLRRRGGQFGNKYNLGVLKSLTQDFFSGIQIQQKPGSTEQKTAMRVFEEIDAIEMEALKSYNQQKGEEARQNGGKFKAVKKFDDLPDDIKDQIKNQKASLSNVRFEQSTQIAYASNHLLRGFEIFHATMGGQEMRIDEMVKWESHGLTGRWVVDIIKMQEEFSEKLVKPLRYAYSTYGKLDFGEIDRVQVGKDDEGMPIYKDIVRADRIFGPIVTQTLKKELFKGRNNLSAEQKQKEWIAYVRGAGREKLWKEALIARVSKDLLSHRERVKNNAYPYMGPEQVEAFYKGLESMGGIEIVENEDGTEDIKFGHTEPFLDEKEQKRMRKHSKTEKWRLYSMDLAPEVGYGLLGGLFAGFRDFVKEGFK